MNELHTYFDLLSGFNPVYFTLLAFILILFVIQIVFKFIIIPQRSEHQKRQVEFAQENSFLMSLFAELDPDPILRIDGDGIIIYSNNTAAAIFNGATLSGSNIRIILPEIDNLSEKIVNNDSDSYLKTINDKTFAVDIRGIGKYGFAQIYFHDITERIVYERELKDFSKRLQISIEDERKRIAKELHDGIGQNLSAARLKVAKLIEGNPGEYSNLDLSEIKSVITESINELKDISYKLKPRVLEEIGLEAALISLCNSFSKDFMIKGILKIDSLKIKQSGEIETGLYRIAQEALSNIQKHSQAAEFSMNLFDRVDKICLIVTDNGRGFCMEEAAIKKGTMGSLGLLSMRERSESMGGIFLLESAPGEGTTIRIEIPAGEMVQI